MRNKIKVANLIANPGCYPTAAILAAMPAIKAGIINSGDCIFDAKSGISGAGRTLAMHSHFCEVTENFAPYQIAGLHRHTPEIEQELSLLVNKPVTVQFTPHLVPMIRGLSVTAYFKLNQALTAADAYSIYQEQYNQEKFIRISAPGKIPQVKSVRGTNYCDVGIYVDERTQRLIVVSVIDNLIKGASGQAVQNMNLMFDLPENMGLDNHVAMYP
jgi:N-acetyl-gamma-glutamyl-phosphate reductase